MNYEIRAEPFTGSPALTPYNNGGHKGDITGADFTHAIYDGDRLIFRTANRQHANTLLARLHAVEAGRYAIDALGEDLRQLANR